ncbi:MAG: hypothetical protein NDI81_07835 [Desulfobacula sp.]|nr:hypothetical protein [Desulfobacula sp.]
MRTFQTQGQTCRTRLLALLVIGIAAVAAVCFQRWDLVRDIYLTDLKNMVLNGAIAVLFAVGIWRLFHAFGRYDFEEKQVDKFIRCIQTGSPAEDWGNAAAPRSIIARRYAEIQELFDRRVPIHQGALSAIMMAEQSAWSSFPRFVNNVLILTGVFGTIVSLIFALVGAGRTLGSAVPTEGMAIMLSGMNTALTTTATAITCFFIYSYFYGKLADVQTHVFSAVEKTVLIHIIPRFAFDAETVNHQTAQLIGQLKALIIEVQKGTTVILNTLAGLTTHNESHLEKLDALIARQDSQLAGTGKVIKGLERLQDVMAEGFRLKPEA